MDGGVIYVTRHAVTAGNAAGLHIGARDERLLGEGRAQARKLAERVSPLGIREVWSSPLARARETASIVASRLRVRLRVDEDLREMALGPWEGLGEDEIRARYPTEHRRWEEDPEGFRLDGHETLPALRARVRRALTCIGGRPGPVLIVTHLAAIRAAALVVTGEEAEAFHRRSVGHCVLLALDLDHGTVREAPDLPPGEGQRAGPTTFREVL